MVFIQEPFLHNHLPIWKTTHKIITKVATFEQLTASTFIPRSISSNFYPFRILCKLGEKHIIIAWAADEKSISADWMWIQQNLVNVMNELTHIKDAQEFLDVKLKGMFENTNPNNNNNNNNNNRNPNELTESKEHLVFDDSTGQVNLEPPRDCSNSDWEVFQKTFPNIFKTEELVTVYNCLLWGKLPTKGTLFLTQYSLCITGFHVKDVIIPFEEIKTIEYPGTSKLKAITVITKSNHKHWISALQGLDQMYGFILELWERMMKDKLLNAEANHAEIQFQHSVQNAKRWNNSSDIERKERSNSSSVKLSSDFFKNDLDQFRHLREFQVLFRVPFDELLFKEYDCRLAQYKSEGRIEERKGTLYLSMHYICFRSVKYSKRKQFTLVIPFQEVKDITNEFFFKDNKESAKENVIRVYTSGIPFTFHTKQPEDLLYELKRKLQLTANERKDFYNSSLVKQMKIHPRIPESIVKDPHQFPPDFFEKDQKKETEWIEYLLPYAGGVSYRTPKLRKLIRNGTPNAYRGHIWLLTSGAYSYMLRFKKGYYNEIVEIALKRSSDITEDIEKDLTRSFPEHPYYQTSEGINALRRTLVAFSYHNPNVGYCQSMNIVCAFLLLFLSEEQSFFVLCVLCDHLIPDYYVTAMIGSIVDERIFRKIIVNELPHIFKHMSNIGLTEPTAMVALPWFLCLFIGYCPFEVSLRICDLFFLEGPRALFAIAFAVFQTYEPLILSTKDAPTLCQKMRFIRNNWDDIFSLAFERLDTLSDEKINSQRNTFRFEVIKEMEEKNKNSLMRDWKKITKFSPEELLKMHSHIMRVTDNYLLSVPQFQRLFLTWVPWFIFDCAGPKEVFRYIDQKGTGFAELNELMRVLSIILKGSTEEKIEFSFKLMDGDRDNLISKEEFDFALRVLAEMTRRSRISSPIEAQDNNIDENDPTWTEYLQHNRPHFDKEAIATAFALSDIEQKNKIDLEGFKNAIDQPVISLSLLLDE